MEAQRARKRSRVGVPFPVPMFEEDYERDERREPTEAQLRTYFDQLDNEHRDWEEYMSGYRVLPYIQQLFMHMVSINMSYDIAKNMFNLEGFYDNDNDVLRARKAEVSSYVRRLIRGATGYERYSYSALLNNPKVLEIDPVGLINFYSLSRIETSELSGSM